MTTYSVDDFVMREVTGLTASRSLTVDMLDALDLDLGGGDHAMMLPCTQLIDPHPDGAPASVHLPAGTPARFVATIDGQRSRVFTVPAGDAPVAFADLTDAVES